MPEATKTDNNSELAVESGIVSNTFATRLAADVSEGFNKAVLFRQTSGVDAKLKYALRAYTRTPSKEEIAFFTAMGVDPESSFDCLTKTKMNSVLALLQRILLPPSGKSYSIESSPSPDVPSHIEGAAYGIILNEYFQYVKLKMETDPEGGEAAAQPEAIVAHVNSRKEEIDNAIINFAKTRAKLMDRKVDDLLREGELGEALEDYLWNSVIYGTGVLVGPCEEFRQVVKIKERKKRDKAEVDQAPVYALETEKSMSFYSPQTCDVYPSEGARRAKDGRLYIIVSFEPSDLADFAYQSRSNDNKKLNGWDAKAVEKVLRRYPTGGHSLESIALNAEFKAMKEEAVVTMSNTNIEGIRCFGKFPGKYLIQCGVTESEYVKTINPHKYYEIDCVLIDTEIVYLNVCDPVIGRPVYKSTFYGTTHSWFGDGLSEVLRPFQSLATVCMTGLKKQTQMTSTPERFVNDVDSFVNSNVPGAFSPSPWKVYLRKVNPYQANQSTQGAPISYVQMPHTIREVLQVMSALTSMVDDYSGFPRNMFGSGNLSGAARTARGLAQIRESANIVADFVVINIDKRITSPVLKNVVNWLNVRGTDDTIKGDVQIIARGALGQALQTAKEETAAAALSIAGNGIFPQILGPKALLLIFRKYLESVGYDNIDDIIGSKEKMELQEQIQLITQLQQINQEQGQQEGAPAGGGGGVEAPVTTQGQPIGQDIARETGGGVPQVAGGVQDRRGAA